MNEKITDKQATSIIVLSILGSSVVLGTARSAKADAWISIIIALIISLIITLCHARLLNNFYGKNYFEICEIVFGKVFGKIFIIMYIGYALFINALIIRDIGEFIYLAGIVNIREISQLFTMTVMMLLCIHMAKKNIGVLGMFCTFFLPVVVFMISIGYMLSINNMSPRNLLPVMYDGIRPVIEGIFYSISFPFTETIVFMMIFNLQKSKKSTTKIFTKGILLAGLFLLIIAILDTMILGTNIQSMSYFPSYASLRRIDIGNFIERIEITIILSFIFSVFVKSTCYLIGASKGITHLFNLKNYTFISTPVGLLVVIISYILYENAKESVETMQFDIWVGIIFQVILFFIIFIGAEIKIRKNKGTNKGQL